MKKVYVLFILLAFAQLCYSQASGGQIMRPSQRQPHKTTRRMVTPSKQSQTTVEKSNRNEVITPTYTPPDIRPIPISNLAIYNIVAGSFSLLGNAQSLCQTLRNNGWGAQIYLDSRDMYRVLMIGSNNEPEAILYRDYARKTYQDAWILQIENGREVRYQ